MISCKTLYYSTRIHTTWFYKNKELWSQTHVHMVGANWTLVVINNNNNNKEGIKQEGKWRGGTGGSWREVVGDG